MTTQMIFVFCAFHAFLLVSGYRSKFSDIADFVESETDKTQAIPCYITERNKDVHYGLSFLIHTSKMKCNWYFVFDPKTGPWKSEVLQNTFSSAQPADSTLCTCNLNRNDETAMSHQYIVGSLPNLMQCDPQTCFTAYAHQMFAASEYRDQDGFRIMANNIEHWDVSKQGEEEVGTVVPTVVETVEDISRTLSPTKKTELLHKVAEQAGATDISDAQEIVNRLEGSSVEDISANIEEIKPDPVVQVVTEEITVDDAAVEKAKKGLTNKGCSGNDCYKGTCIDNQCVCDFGYIGPSCEVAPQNRNVIQEKVVVEKTEFEETMSRMPQPEAADAVTDMLSDVIVLEHKQGICAYVQPPSADVQCGPITTARACSAAKVFLEKKNEKYPTIHFGAFSDYSESSSDKLRDSMPGFCAAKLINGKHGARTWHVKFNGVDRSEHRAQSTGRNDMIHYRLICGCWPTAALEA